MYLALHKRDMVKRAIQRKYLVQPILKQDDCQSVRFAAPSSVSLVLVHDDSWNPSTVRARDTGLLLQRYTRIETSLITR
jgi:hypothetical protein